MTGPHAWIATLTICVVILVVVAVRQRQRVTRHLSAPSGAVTLSRISFARYPTAGQRIAVNLDDRISMTGTLISIAGDWVTMSDVVITIPHRDPIDAAGVVQVPHGRIMWLQATEAPTA